ncbi:unnamed protein product [Cuscuta epithymum]|uniref:Uncharacterized protein n=1 Tax=Cuscuta epithymum TaxID=186058 RepID=A0AAV0EU61_9ASTE|nr:unnamed protein product [Cuscuta epithymum]
MALEQRALYLRSQNLHPDHQAFVAQEQAAAVRPPVRGGGPSRGNGGRGYRGSRGRGTRGRGRGYGAQQGPGYGSQQGAAYGGQQAPPAHGQQGWQQGPPRGHAPAGFPGFPPVENNYHNPPPPVVCQLCYSPGHSAITCPRFTNPSTPALAAIPTGETNASVWYPDSGASAHMTPHEGQSHGSHSSPGIQ